MSSAPRHRPVRRGPGIPPLRHGQRLKQPEFHRRYEACDEDQKFELVGGTVYMASPLRKTHSDYDGKLGLVLELYALETPGVHVLHGATTILGEESEPQPDLGLRVQPEFGGRSRNSPDDYVEGPPELLAEVAHSTRRLDLGAKRADYRRAGVLEYLVLCVEEQVVYWFHFPGDRTIRPGRQGISRSRAFPGLWLDTAALLRLDSQRLREVIEQGLASSAHAAFARRLQRQRQRGEKGRRP
jgi:Uma2 family endonuclease